MSLYSIEDTTREEREAMYAEMIQDAFVKDVRYVTNMNSLSVPFVHGPSGKNVLQSLSDAVAEEIAEKAAHKQLMAILANSPCEMVQSLRVLMAKSYADKWVSELAEMGE